MKSTYYQIQNDLDQSKGINVAITETDLHLFLCLLIYTSIQLIRLSISPSACLPLHTIKFLKLMQQFQGRHSQLITFTGVNNNTEFPDL